MTRTVNGTGQGWDECVSFNPLKDWWVMYEKKSRKRSRDDDDGVDDNRRAVHPFETLVVVVVVAWVSCNSSIAHTHTRDLDAVASHTLRPLCRPLPCTKEDLATRAR